MIKRFISISLALLVCNMLTYVPAMAHTPSFSNTALYLTDSTAMDITPDQEVSDQDTVAISSNQSINETLNKDEELVQLKPKSRISSMQVSNQDVSSEAEASSTSLVTASLGDTPCNSYTVTLQDNQMHLLTFQISSSKVLFSKFESTDSNYSLALCMIGDDGTVSILTDFIAPNANLNTILPAGNYGFLIINNGNTFGNSYTVRVNTSTPGSNVTNASLYKVNTYYSHAITLAMTSGSNNIFCDGKFITNLSNTENLDWERVLDLSWSGGYNYNKHEIYNSTINDVSLPGKYTSNYVNSNNAVVIFLGAGTGYMYNESKRSSQGRVFTYLDPFGNTTPRTLTDYDIDNYQCWLIYDLDKQEPIDFWSSLNWYYATGTESATFQYK